MAACMNCSHAFDLSIEQNSMDRRCFWCGSRTCLVCGSEAHFPASCLEFSTLVSRPLSANFIVPARYWNYYQDLISFNDARVEGYGGWDALYFINSDLYAASIELETILRILKFTQVIFITYPSLLRRETVERFHKLSVYAEEFVNQLDFAEELAEEFEAAQHLPVRFDAACAVIHFLMSLLSARSLLGSVKLLHCLPTFPLDLIPNEPVFGYFPDAPGFFLRRPYDLEAVWEDLIHNFHRGISANALVSAFALDHTFIPPIPSVDLNQAGVDAELALTYSTYAECFLWSVTMTKR